MGRERSEVSGGPVIMAVNLRHYDLVPKVGFLKQFLDKDPYVGTQQTREVPRKKIPVNLLHHNSLSSYESKWQFIYK